MQKKKKINKKNRVDSSQLFLDMTWDDAFNAVLNFLRGRSVLPETVIELRRVLMHANTLKITGSRFFFFFVYTLLYSTCICNGQLPLFGTHKWWEIYKIHRYKYTCIWLTIIRTTAFFLFFRFGTKFGWTVVFFFDLYHI